MSLDIAKERIRTAKFHGIKTLDLSYLNLSEIPREILDLGHITHLYLENNKITNLDRIRHLKGLKLLQLQGNEITELPMFLFHLDAPTHYYSQLDYNTPDRVLELTQHAISIVKLIIKSYQTYYDRRNASAVIKSREIHKILSTTNQLIDIINLTETEANNFENLSSQIETFRLKTESLAHLIGEDLSLTEDISKIKHLNSQPEINLNYELTHEEDAKIIKTIKSALIEQDYQLARIIYQDQVADSRRLLYHISGKRDAIMDMSFALEKGPITIATSIQILYAVFYILAELVTNKFDLTEVPNGLFLANNPIKNLPPPEIIGQGNSAILSFLGSFFEKETLNEVKVILVGEGASGKTSVVKRIHNEPFDRKESQTHGIKISKRQLKHDGEDFLVNFWDFGGQEIMHNTHQFFLTKRCLYMLVLDSRKDEKAEFWLNYIQSFGGNAPVVIVLNKIDENPSFEVNRKFLNKKYRNIIGYYRVSCLTDEGISKLRKSLMNRLWNLELRQTAFPRGWLKVKQRLENMSEDYIGYKQYQEICMENHVAEDQSQKVLLELLNDLGVVLNYDNLRLHDTQVLNPLWLTNAVYRIINSPIVAKSNGRFRIQELHDIINDERYQKDNPKHWINISKYWKPEKKPFQFPPEKFLFIVAMMKEFELLYQVEEGEYLVPALLSNEENLYFFAPDEPLVSLIIEYKDFLPPSIIPRLMVKLHKSIYKNQIWKTGMVLSENLILKSTANIVLDKESKKVHIAINGKRKRDFLTVIRETIKEVNATYQDIETIEWVPLPEKYQNERVLVDYQELEGLEAMNQELYFSGKLKKSFVVSELLNGVEKANTRTAIKPLHIFVSYAHKDTEFMERLIEHLMPLVRLNKASVWYDKSIDAGEEWESKIVDNLEKADIVLCLISSGFINSKFCYEKELDPALLAHREGTKAVIPIRIKECLWDSLEISKVQGLPAKWMTNIEDHKSWTEIARGVEKVINKMKKI